MGKISINNLPASLLPVQNYLYADLHLDFQENFNNSNFLFQHSEEKDLKIDYDVDAIKNSLNNLFTTTPGEKILNPEFGMELRKYLFEPATIEVAERIRSDIYIQVGKFEPRVKINNVQITVFEDVGEFDIVVYFSIPSINIHNVSFFGTLNNNGYNYRS
jgi:phage baseplate assembly protein W